MSVLIFARAPEPGQCKTRLIPQLGAEGAAALHIQLLERTLSIATAAHRGLVQLWCTPDSDHPYFAECQRRWGVSLHTQQGADLGARMNHAFQQSLSPSTPAGAILLGCDAPELAVEHLHQAREQLAAGMDVVLGPAHDGGYVLIGLRQPCPALFTQMPWGSDQVLAITRQRIAALDLHHYELPPQPDLDRPEDLR